MPAAKRKHQGKPALTLHTDPFTGDPNDAWGEFVVSTHHQLVDAELRVHIGGRERAIARGEPIEGSIYLPNYEKLDPTSDEYRLPIHLDQIENIANALLLLAKEAKRLGVLPTAKPQEG